MEQMTPEEAFKIVTEYSDICDFCKKEDTCWRSPFFADCDPRNVDMDAVIKEAAEIQQVFEEAEQYYAETYFDQNGEPLI